MACYFIRAGESGPVKIGKADNVADRLTSFQIGHYEQLYCLREIDGGLREEAWLHRHFASLHVRGEWHRYSPEMMTVEIPLRNNHSASDIIDGLGGTAAVARMLGCDRSAVSNWRTDGISARRWAQLVATFPGLITYEELAAAQRLARAA